MDKNFLFSIASRPNPRPIQPHIQLVPGALSSGLAPNAEVKNGGVIPPYNFMAWSPFL
jgi:hypothetical protein